jgi:hypothetical protein
LAFRFPYGFFQVFFLVDPRIGTRLSGQGQAGTTFTMHVTPITALSSAIHKSSFFEFENELADFPGHRDKLLQLNWKAKPLCEYETS